MRFVVLFELTSVEGAIVSSMNDDELLVTARGRTVAGAFCGPRFETLGRTSHMPQSLRWLQSLLRIDEPVVGIKAKWRLTW